MAAQTKAELLAISQKEFAKLAKLTGTLSAETALQKREGDTSIKDVVAHRAHWIELFLGWYTDGMAGKPVYFPAATYKWNDLTRYNADLRARQVDLGWPEAMSMLEAAYADLTTFIDAHSDTELYSGPMKGANNQWTPGRWAEAAGPSHFRSASKFIRAALRDDATASAQIPDRSAS